MKVTLLSALAGVLLSCTPSGALFAQDNCADAAPLTVNVPLDFDLTGATNQGAVTCIPEPALNNSQPDLWYSFTAPTTGCYEIALGNFVDGTPLDATLFIYASTAAVDANGCPIDASMICADGGVNVDLNAGETILIRLAAENGIVTVSTGQICVQGANGLPPTLSLEAEVGLDPSMIGEGTQFTVVLNMDFENAVEALNFDITYDPAVLQLVSVSRTQIALGNMNWAGNAPTFAGSIGIAAGQLSFGALFVDGTGGSSALIPSDLPPIELTFEALAVAADTVTTIQFIDDPATPATSVEITEPCTIVNRSPEFLLAGDVNGPPNTLAVTTSHPPVGGPGFVFELTILDAPPCAPPTDLTASVTPQGVQLDWLAGTGNLDFEIWRNGAMLDTSTTESYLDTAPPVGDVVYFIRGLCTAPDFADSLGVSVFVIRYAIDSMIPSVGSIVDVPVTLEFLGGDVAGGTFGLLHDDMILTATTTTTDGSAVAAFNGGVGPDFEDVSIVTGPPAGLTYAFILDTAGTEVLAPGGPLEIVQLRYDVVAGAPSGLTDLVFTGGLAPSGPVTIPVAASFIPAAGGSSVQTPAVGVDGSVLVGGNFIRGDVNGSDTVDLADAIRLLEFLFLGGPAVDCDDALDANDDEVTSIPDAIYLLEYLFGGSTPPSAPFPACGTDPTTNPQPPGPNIDCATNTGTC